MKTKLKPISRKASVKLVPAVRASAKSPAPLDHKPVPLNERRLNFGDKWDYAPAPEDSKRLYDCAAA